MESPRITHRALRRRIVSLLSGSGFDAALKEIASLPGRRAVSPVIGLFCSTDPLIRWRAVTAFGVVAAGIADRDMESARVVMRRLMWSLNDESGGIGWGAPEAMGEAAARHDRIFAEYGSMLVSYIRPDCNFLEHEGLQRGTLWGLGRMAHARPGCADGLLSFLAPFFTSTDAHHRGLAAWAARASAHPPVEEFLRSGLLADEAELPFYRDGFLLRVTVARLAAGDLPVEGPTGAAP